MANSWVRIIRYGRTVRGGHIFRMAGAGYLSAVRDVNGIAALTIILRCLTSSAQDLADTRKRLREDGGVTIPVGCLTEQQMEIVRL
jgi:hypothetical protein